MSGSEHARPSDMRLVPISEHEIERLTYGELYELLKSRFHAAPADPDMAILSVLMAELSYDQRCERTADAVLRALGYPND